MKIVLQTAAVALALSLSVAPAQAQRINSGGQGQYGRVSLETGFEPDPYMVSVLAGGPVDAGSLSPDCNGALSERASFTLNYRAGDTLPLIISAVSEADTVLAVRGPDRQWSCNDDADLLNPAVRYDAPRSGRYQIWVGSYDPEQTATAMLYVSEIGTGVMFADVSSAASPPDWSLDPAYGVIDLVSGFQPDPHMQDILAGGEYDASNLQPNCRGWIATAPDYRVNFTAGNNNLPLIFSVNSDSDTTLVINGPNADWICDDDGGENLNPSVRLDSPASGQYDIWVGTYSQGPLQESTLHVSELTSQ